jgi:hypothetical protein
MGMPIVEVMIAVAWVSSLSRLGEAEAELELGILKIGEAWWLSERMGGLRWRKS